MATVVVPLTFGYCGGDPLGHWSREFRRPRRSRSRVERSCRSVVITPTAPPTTPRPSRPSRPPLPNLQGKLQFTEQRRPKCLTVDSLHTKGDDTRPTLSRHPSIDRYSSRKDDSIRPNSRAERLSTPFLDADTRLAIQMQPPASTKGILKGAPTLSSSPTECSPRIDTRPIRSSSISKVILNSIEPTSPTLLLYQRLRRQSSVDPSPPQPTQSSHAHLRPGSREELEKTLLNGSQVLRRVYQSTKIGPGNWMQFDPRSQSPEPIEFRNTPGWTATLESLSTPDSIPKDRRDRDRPRSPSTAQEPVQHGIQPEISKLQDNLRKFCKQTTFHGRDFQVLDIDSIIQQFEVDELPFDLDGTPLIYNLPNAIAATDYGVQDPCESVVDPARCLEEDDPMGQMVFEVFSGCVEFCIMLHGCLVLLMDDLNQALSRQEKCPHRFGGLEVFYAKYNTQYTSSNSITGSHPPTIFSPDASFLESMTTIDNTESDLPFLSSSGDIWVSHTDDVTKQGKAFVKVRSRDKSEVVGVVIPTHLLIPPPSASLSTLLRSRNDIHNLTSTKGMKVHAQKACKEALGEIIHCFDHETAWPKGTLLRPINIQNWALESLRHDQSLAATAPGTHNPHAFDEFTNPAPTWYDRDSLPYNVKLQVIGDLPVPSRAIGTDSHRRLFGTGAMIGQKLRKCLKPKLRTYDFVLQRSFLYRRLTTPTVMEGLSGAAVVTLTKEGKPREIVGMQQGVLLCGWEGDDRDEKPEMVEKRLSSGASSVYVMKPPCYQLKKDYELVKEESRRDSTL